MGSRDHWLTSRLDCSFALWESLLDHSASGWDPPRLYVHQGNSLTDLEVAASTSTTVLDLAYSYAQSSHNNGNITSQANNLSGESGRTQSYAYDALNRLLTAQTQATEGGDCWALKFDPTGATPPTAGANALANLLKMTPTALDLDARIIPI